MQTSDKSLGGSAASLPSPPGAPTARSHPPCSCAGRRRTRGAASRSGRGAAHEREAQGGVRGGGKARVSARGERRPRSACGCLPRTQRKQARPQQAHLLPQVVILEVAIPGSHPQLAALCATAGQGWWWERAGRGGWGRLLDRGQRTHTLPPPGLPARSGPLAPAISRCTRSANSCELSPGCRVWGSRK